MCVVICSFASGLGPTDLRRKMNQDLPKSINVTNMVTGKRDQEGNSLAAFLCAKVSQQVALRLEKADLAECQIMECQRVYALVSALKIPPERVKFCGTQSCEWDFWSNALKIAASVGANNIRAIASGTRLEIAQWNEIVKTPKLGVLFTHGITHRLVNGIQCLPSVSCVAYLSIDFARAGYLVGASICQGVHTNEIAKDMLLYGTNRT